MTMKKVLFLLAFLALAVGSYSQDLSGPVTGIEDDYELVELKAYPNPVSTDLTVELDIEDSEYDVSVIDLQGRVVRKTVARKNRFTLDLTPLPEGTYVLTVYSKKGDKANLIKLSKLR